MKSSLDLTAKRMSNAERRFEGPAYDPTRPRRGRRQAVRSEEVTRMEKDTPGKPEEATTTEVEDTAADKGGETTEPTGEDKAG